MSNKARAAAKAPDAEAVKEAASAGAGEDTVLNAVRKLTERAKANGSVTYDDINEFLPEDQVSSDQIEDVMAQLSEAGVTVAEADNAEGDSDEEENEESTDVANPTGNIKDEDVGRTDDPVRMYLREMGSVELLSREGEIAIAKRIEAGREDLISGICESPLTFSALMSWRQSLQEGVVMLRDVIDLDSTYAAHVRALAGDEDEDDPSLDFDFGGRHLVVPTPASPNSATATGCEGLGCLPSGTSSSAVAPTDECVLPSSSAS